MKLRAFVVRRLLGASGWLVPSGERTEWKQEWAAEFETQWLGPQRGSLGADLLRCVAAVKDAAWMRWDARPAQRISGRALAAALLRDLRFALRRLRMEPWTSLLIVVILGAGLGANVAIYTLVHSLFYQPLAAAREPDRLARVYNRFVDGFEWGEVSLPELRAFAGRDDIVEEAFGEAYTFVDLGIGDEREITFASVASPTYFRGLGLEPALGRLLVPADGEAPGASPVAVVSHAFWMQRLGGDTRAVGRTVVINGRDFEIVGVTPRAFTGSMRGLSPAFWLPASMHAIALPGSRWYEEPATASLYGMVRLRTGVSLQTARHALEATFQDRKDVRPEQYRTHAGLSLIPEGDGAIHPYYRGLALRFVVLLRFAVALLLCLSCANAAGLLLASATARNGELSVRLALGAGRAGLLRQLLIEAGVLAVLAGVAGTALTAVWTSVASGARLGTDVPLSFQLDVDARVVMFALVATAMTTLLSGGAPALIATRADVASLLRGAAVGGGRSPLRRVLVIGQIAISCALLVGAGLLFRGLQAAASIDSGLQIQGVVTASVAPSLHGYDRVGSQDVQRDLGRRLESVPGIEAVTFTSWKPFQLNPSVTRLEPEGYESLDGVLPTSDFAVVDWHYADALELQLLGGRFLSEHDRADTEPVVVVNDAFVRRFWPGESTSTRRVRVWNRWRRVVGITATSKYRSLNEDPRPFLYLPMEQEPRDRFHIHVRGSLPPEALVDVLRNTVRDLDPALTLANVGKLADTTALPDLLPRAGIVWLGSFGVVALLLAAAGLYGLLAWSVVRRRREIGTRIALGARPARVVSMVIREGLWLGGAGLTVGLPLAWLTGQALSGWLYGVQPTDVWAWSVGALIGLAVAAVASLLPAWRASRVDPIAAMRMP